MLINKKSLDQLKKIMKVTKSESDDLNLNNILTFEEFEKKNREIFKLEDNKKSKSKK